MNHIIIKNCHILQCNHCLLKQWLRKNCTIATSLCLQQVILNLYLVTIFLRESHAHTRVVLKGFMSFKEIWLTYTLLFFGWLHVGAPLKEPPVNIGPIGQKSMSQFFFLRPVLVRSILCHSQPSNFPHLVFYFLNLNRGSVFQS